VTRWSPAELDWMAETGARLTRNRPVNAPGTDGKSDKNQSS
jgi:hypothetical protein